jgi:hypothetical protein
MQNAVMGALLLRLCKANYISAWKGIVINMKIVRIIFMFIFIPLIYVFLTLKSLTKTKKYRGILEPGEWYEINTKGLKNSKGKATPFFVRKGGDIGAGNGASSKLMIYFCGGGVSWSEVSAAKPMNILKMMLGSVTYYSPVAYRFVRTLFNGILSKKQNNPFSDWNTVFIPYVTGDFHLGNNEFKYQGGRKTLYHAGEPNTKLIMDEVKKLFPDIEMLFICGESAGAFGAAGNAPLVAGYYPDVPVIVYSDASQLVVPLWREAAEKVWLVNKTMLEYIGEDGDLYYDLIRYSYAKLGDRAVFLRSNTLYDVVLIEFGSTLQGGLHKATPEAKKYFSDSLTATEKRIMESDIPYYFYLCSYGKNKKTGLTMHTMSHNEKSFHDNGEYDTSLAEWLTDAVNGKLYSIGH